MCGIFGCISDEASMRVLEGLRKLEYRGYDSAGLAALFPEQSGPIETERTTGYVADLVSKANGRFNGSHISIGHTRWATHGGVTDENAHPHSSEDGHITVVHNGIIENANELTETILNYGYQMSSETDSEVIVHLLDFEMKNQPKNKTHLDAFCEVISKLRGSWAIAVIISGLEGILISRNGAPMVIGRGNDGISVSSDALPFYGACSEIAYMHDGENFLLTRNGIVAAENCEKPTFEILDGVYDEQDPGNFQNMMMKEIHDQPVALSNVLGGRISPSGGRSELSGFALSPKDIKNLDRINLVACGTAYYAASLGTRIIREHANVVVEAFRSSEFPAERVCGKKSLTIGITQSGETKDTLDALHSAKLSGGHISSITNVIGSTISRFTGNGAYLYAGPEYAVASTKAFSNMVAAQILLAVSLSDKPLKERRELLQQVRLLPSMVSTQLLEEDGSIDRAVELLSSSDKAIFIGRGNSVPLVEEGALKTMEVSYLPCLAYPGGELKHGPIALIEKGTPVIAVAPSDNTLALMESSIRECKSRGAKIILITDNEGPILNFADVVISTLYPGKETSPLVNIIPLQLMACKLAIKLGLNVDRPRNLAKSVTVV